MHNVQLENVLYLLREKSVNWFFIKISEGLSSTDLMCLPDKYIQKMSDFVSFHTFEYLLEMEPEDFIEQATGEKISKILKLLEVGKKIKSINSDFE